MYTHALQLFALRRTLRIFFEDKSRAGQDPGQQQAGGAILFNGTGEPAGDADSGAVYPKNQGKQSGKQGLHVHK